MKTIKEELQKEEEKLRKVMEKWQKLMLQVPNIPDMSVPDGKDDADNKEIKVWGEKPEFSFEPKSHIDIMKKLLVVFCIFNFQFDTVNLVLVKAPLFFCF